MTWRAAAIGALLMSGCASIAETLNINRPDPVPFPTLSACQVSSPTVEQANKDFDLALRYCRNMFSYYARSSQSAAERRFYIGVVGTIAGGVVAPALAAGNRAKSSIAAWSGVGGVTNAAQADLNNGTLSEAAALAEQRKVASDVEAIVNAFVSTTDPLKRCDAARRLVAKCAASEVKS